MYKIIVCFLLFSPQKNLINKSPYYPPNAITSDSLPFQTAITASLSHYPELLHASIKFKQTAQESTGKTTMSFLSLFHKNRRHYIIRINNDAGRTGFLLQDLTTDEQIGVIGHELAHVVDFSHRDFFGMIGFGLSYLNKHKRRELERATDLRTINHGLVPELLEWSTFVLKSPLTTPAYKQMRKRFYLSPEEIRKFIVSSPK